MASNKPKTALDPSMVKQPVRDAVGAAGDNASMRYTNATDVAQLAYKYWQERGCPDGSPDEDWFRAERDIRNPARS